MTTYGAPNDGKVFKLTTFCFYWTVNALGKNKGSVPCIINTVNTYKDLVTPFEGIVFKFSYLYLIVISVIIQIQLKFYFQRPN